jgi:predicted transcriptional regulator
MPWTFLTTHGLVLVEIAVDPHQTMRAVAEKLGISERTVQSVVHDLVTEGYVTRTRIGRRNAYQVNRGLRMRHPAFGGHSVATLLRAFE